jgi:hypothetical protein
LLWSVKFDVKGGGREGALDVIPAQCAVEGTQNLIVRYVHHKAWEFIFLISVVDTEILPEGCELVNRHSLVCEEVLREFGELRHEFVGYELPLDVESEAGLIDPSIQPSTAVSTVKVLGLELQKNAWIILREEEIFTTVVEVVLRDVLVLHFDQICQLLIVSSVVVLACIDP